ncbi:MAG TPA: MASE1 domain-containing protein [Aggregatilineales bacterium]|nr:MASE1 domain-containing protein [Anaerolineales bacterium]HRE47614.1 MASE1 domain-containing protein [Aggregatilineales bacterium]
MAAITAAVGIVYALTAQIGFQFAIAGNVTAVWLPSGVALAAVISFRRTALPGILLGSFYGNIRAFYAPESLPTALTVSLIIGLGAVLEAYLGDYLLRRFTKIPHYPFTLTNDVLIFAGLAALGACLINATMGTISITLAGYAKPENFAITWVTWWLGDAVGILIITPALLIFSRRPPYGIERLPETLLHQGLFLLLGFLAFRSGYPIEYTIIPILLVSVFRFEQYGAAGSILIVALIALVTTIQGVSSFRRPDLNESLLLVQAFVSTVAITALILAAEISGRRASQENLEERVRLRTRELEETNAQLNKARLDAEAANKAKSAFLATMSHELRTPLNAVVGYTEIQLAGMAGELNDEQRNYQERVLVNARDLLGLINEILDLSKIEVGRLDIINKPYTLRTMVNELIAQYHVLAEEKQIALTVDLDPALPNRIMGDMGRVKQIVVNLLSNALKFTEKGAVEVHLKKVSDASWSLAVTDSGMGIPSHLQETIFDEFRQGDSAANRQHNGTGLGLAIVRKLALLMSGNVRVQSTPGQGSTFTVTLPLIPA